MISNALLPSSTLFSVSSLRVWVRCVLAFLSCQQARVVEIPEYFIISLSLSDDSDSSRLISRNWRLSQLSLHCRLVRIGIYGDFSASQQDEMRWKLSPIFFLLPDETEFLINKYLLTIQEKNKKKKKKNLPKMYLVCRRSNDVSGFEIWLISYKKNKKCSPNKHTAELISSQREVNRTRLLCPWPPAINKSLELLSCWDSLGVGVN